MRRLYWLLMLGAVAITAAAGFRWYAAQDTPARRHARLAERLGKQGDGLGAARQWQIAAALDPTLVEAREALGRQYLADGAVALAIREFRKVTELAPRRPHAYCQAAEALRLGGIQDLALRAARYAARSEPRCFRARRTLGLLLRDRADYRAALGELEAAARLDPRDPEVKLALARIQLGLAQTAPAEANARAALALDPQDPAPAGFLGHLLVQQGDRARAAEAEQLLRAAAAGDPQSGTVAMDLAQVLQWKGRPLAARWELERAATLLTGDPEPMQRLAAVYTTLGDSAKAAQARRRAEQLSAARLSRTEMERRLAQDPLDGRLLYQLGDLYARDHQYLRAIDHLSRAADLLYGDPTVRRRLAEVRAEASRAELVLDSGSGAGS